MQPLDPLWLRRIVFKAFNFSFPKSALHRQSTTTSSLINHLICRKTMNHHTFPNETSHPKPIWSTSSPPIRHHIFTNKTLILNTKTAPNKLQPLQQLNTPSSINHNIKSNEPPQHTSPINNNIFTVDPWHPHQSTAYAPRNNHISTNEPPHLHNFVLAFPPINHHISTKEISQSANELPILH